MNSWQDKILEIIFPTPRICPVCKKPQPQLQLCADCWAKLAQKRVNHGQCQRCGTYGVRAKACDNCRDWPKYLQANYSALPYDDDFRQAILDFKYRGRPWMAKALAEIMLPLVPSAAEMILPVPLHKNRLRQRGFNQSALIARALSQAAGIAEDEKILLRVVDTPHQTGLSRTERMRNLQGAFQVVRPEAVQGRHVLLIDDVLTTGTTIVQCAKVLHQAGCAAVSSMTIASGVK